jgi:hypothetical protein
MCRPNFALLVLVVGQLGLIQDSLPKPAPASWMNLHILFGALLWVCVVARFYRGMRQAPRMLPAEIHALSRQLSRLVYLLLYVLMFFGLIIGIVRAALHDPIVGGAENFQSYLVGGLAALVTIRALAALCYRFVIRGQLVIRDGMGAPVEAVQRNGRLTKREPASPKRQGWSTPLEIPIRGPQTTRARLLAAVRLNGALSSRLPFNWCVTARACPSRPGPEQSNRRSRCRRRTLMTEIPATGSRARISTPAPCPASRHTKFRHQWMP